jgi:hypothetical protein
MRSPSKIQSNSSDLPTPGVVACCVPYWDMARFLAEGGHYTPELGYYVSLDQELDDFHEWLPRKWQYRGSPAGPVILPDMLPTTSWEANLRTQLSEPEWDRLRRFCYQAAGNTCIACGSRGEPHVEAHEAWSFNEKSGVQKLKAILCLCPACHKIKHLGFAQRIGMLPQVLQRLKWLNDWTEPQLRSELVKVQIRQEVLSARTWTLDLSFLRAYGVR